MSETVKARVASLLMGSLLLCARMLKPSPWQGQEPIREDVAEGCEELVAGARAAQPLQTVRLEIRLGAPGVGQQAFPCPGSGGWHGSGGRSGRCVVPSGTGFPVPVHQHHEIRPLDAERRRNLRLLPPGILRDEGQDSAAELGGAQAQSGKVQQETVRELAVRPPELVRHALGDGGGVERVVGRWFVSFTYLFQGLAIPGRAGRVPACGLE